MKVLAFATLISCLSGTLALPAADLPGGISKDTIRYTKCAKIVNSNKYAANGDSWERGMAAYYASKDAAGPPSAQVLFDMQAAKGDIFYDHGGSAYGGRQLLLGRRKNLVRFLDAHADCRSAPRCLAR